jgi:acyl-CoA dehydrogenase
VTQDMLTDSVERLLADSCTPARIRDIEGGAPIDALWRTLHDSGFMDALIPETAGGAGLNLSSVFPIVLACGKHAVPAPLAQTMLVRAILAAAGMEVPSGPITIAPAAPSEQNDALACAHAPYGRIAEWVLTSRKGSLLLLPVKAARMAPTGVYASLEAGLAWSDIPKDAASIDTPHEIRAVGAALYAAQLAGAMERIVATTIRYANERVQFGRSIGKFQVIQHHLSVMAEQALAARMAAQMGCHSSSHLPDPNLAAVAKARTSEAAVTVASLGHAVHGAMGFTAEYELQLYTRRLHEWRLAYGSESHWNQKIGAALLADQETTLDFTRTRLFPTA